jgi:hypothetical protein
MGHGHLDFNLFPNRFQESIFHPLTRLQIPALARQATQPGGIGSLESILGLLKRIKIRALCCVLRTAHCTCNAHPVLLSYRYRT